jgi:hypothetical protein
MTDRMVSLTTIMQCGSVAICPDQEVRQSTGSLAQLYFLSAFELVYHLRLTGLEFDAYTVAKAHTQHI